MSLFVEKYRAAQALEKKYQEAPRAGWIKPGSRATGNQAIMVQRTEVIQLAMALAGSVYNNFTRLYEVMNLQGYMSQLAEDEPDAIVCHKCHNNYLPGWMNGKCPYCEAEAAATSMVDEMLGGAGE